jgi:hypothetical protein
LLRLPATAKNLAVKLGVHREARSLWGRELRRCQKLAVKSHALDAFLQIEAVETNMILLEEFH